MKLRYLISLFVAFLAIGCTEITNDSFENLKVNKTYLSIPEEGGEVTLTVNATEDWKFVVTDKWPNKIEFNKDENNKTIKATYDSFGNMTNPESDIKKSEPSWLSVSVLEGVAGETKVVFSAEKGTSRDIEVRLYAGNNIQNLMVCQGSKDVEDATCADVIAGADGKSFKVKGVCTAISNTTYGNWYLNDGTGEIYIYGTLNKDGEEKKFTEWGIEVGDIVEVQGPKTTYGTTVELVNVTVNSITKSLLKLPEEEVVLEKEDTTFTIKAEFKGGSLYPKVAEDCRSWLSVLEVNVVEGTPSKIEPNPADTAYVTLGVQANTKGARAGKVSLTSGSTTIDYTFTQKGSIAEVSIAEFLAAPVDDNALYRVTGKIVEIENTTYGNVYIADATDTVYVYTVFENENKEKKSFANLGARVGDMITLVGIRAAYNGTQQMKNAYCESIVKSTDATVAEFLAAAESKDVYYRLTGTVESVANETYGNFTIKDASGSVYVYGLTKVMVAKNDKTYASLGIKVGDTVTLCGYRTSYSGTAQVGGAYYISHVAAAAN